MSRKNVLIKYQTITAGDMSASSITSAVTNCQYLDNMAMQFNLTGASSANGTLSIQVSIDHEQDSLGNVSVAGNWVEILSINIASGSPNPILADLNQLSGNYVRAVYTKSSGTGTMNAFISGKEI